MKVIISLTFLIFFANGYSQIDSKNLLKEKSIYNDAINQFLIKFVKVQHINIDTLFILNDFNNNYHLNKMISNMQIHLMDSGQLVKRVTDKVFNFYIKITAIHKSDTLLDVLINMFQIDGDDEEMGILASRDQLKFSYRSHRRKYFFIDFTQQFGYCSAFYRFDKLKKRFLLDHRICI